MGQMLLACADEIPELEVVGQIDAGDDLSGCIDKADVVIDFSLHDATLAIAMLCAREGQSAGHRDHRALRRRQAGNP